MKTAPNATTVTGVLRSCHPAADGFGGEVEIEVAANETADPRADFIRPEPGRPLRAFYGELNDRPGGVRALVGRRVRVQLSFLGGPTGGRVVVRKLRAL
ncbi:MAG: hypothetical protein HS128_02030 [Ideonella sp.]|nr:hypothetical protein [Ideonella sp.]MCC7458519.1 hypothetical protein [Nitrospira sp.]